MRGRAILEPLLDLLVDDHVIQKKKVGREDQRVLLVDFLFRRRLDDRDLGERLLERLSHESSLLVLTQNRTLETFEREFLSATVDRRADRDSVRGRAAIEDDVLSGPLAGPPTARLPDAGLFQILESFVTTIERIDEARVLDDSDQLCRDRRQRLDLLHLVIPASAGLDDERSHRAVANGQRDAQVRVKLLLASLGKVHVARVDGRILHRERAELADDSTGESLPEFQSHLAEGRLVEPVRRRESELPVRGIQQVDRADIGAHLLGDELHCAIQNLGQRMRTLNDERE